jgi:hypothetical protein
MRRSILSLVLVLAASSWCSSSARADVVYVSRVFNAFGTVDLTTGVYTSIGTTSVGLDGLAFAPDGMLYGMGSDNTLYKVDKATAGLTKVGATGSFFGLVNFAGRSDGALYGTDPFTNGPGGFVDKVDPATGKATAIGQSGLSGGFAATGGLAFGPGNTLYLDYGLFTTDLYTVNQNNGQATKVGNSGVSTGGLVFAGGKAYAFNFFGEIYTFDLTTGAATDTGVAVQGGFGPIDAAAAGPAGSPIPEPASLTLLSLGALGLAGYAWRRRHLAAA